MDINNSICFKYERQINNEVAAGQQFDYLKVDALKKMELDSGFKQKWLGISPNQPKAMYDLVKDSIDVVNTLRFTHTLSLLEGFSKEYLSFRNGVPIEQLKTSLSTYQSSWIRENQGIVSSTSLLNLSFVKYVLEDAFHLSFTSVKESCFWESGILRNCIIHHQSVVPNEEYRLALKNTILKLGHTNSVGSRIVLTDAFIWSVIESSRKFIEACDF